jgi:glycosyltransferase involved in cell wall biosynthesis
MKIGFDIRTINTKHTTGVDSYTRELMQQWTRDSRGHQFVLFGDDVLREHPLVVGMMAQGHTFVSQPWHRKIFNFCNVFFGLPKIDKLVGQVDVFFMPHIMFWAFSKKAKLVATFHDLTYEVASIRALYGWKQNLWHKIVDPHALAKRANSIVTISHASKRDLENIYHIPSEKINVTHLAADYDYYANSVIEADIDVPEKYILFLGSVEPRKNPKAVIEAFRMIMDEFPDVHLILAGSYFPQKDAAAVELAEKTPRVKLWGRATNQEKVLLYRKSTMFVLPSFYEGFGIPVIEAQAAGTPVITSNVSCLPEAAGEGALLVDPYNVSDIAQAMKKLLSNETLRTELINKGQTNAQKFSWERVANETFDVLERTAKS